MCVSLLMLFKNFLQDVKLHLNVAQLFSDSQEQARGAACQRNAIHPFSKECLKYSKYPWTQSGGNKAGILWRTATSSESTDPSICWQSKNFIFSKCC